MEQKTFVAKLYNLGLCDLCIACKFIIFLNTQ